MEETKVDKPEDQLSSADSQSNVEAEDSRKSQQIDVRKRRKEDFEFGSPLGVGSFGTVTLATEISSGNVYAAKILDKQQIKKFNKVETVSNEKNILNSLDHHNIVRLFFTFQDPTNLYFILELCPNGELLDLIKKAGRFDLKGAKFYAAELLTAIEYMHNKGIIHRDLKPENILLGPKMHLKINDFGTAQVIGNETDAKATSFVGTAEYVSPELLTQKWAGKISDIWAFGCIIYQMLVGKPPFKGETEFLTFQKIIERDFSYPEDVQIADEAKDIIDRLLKTNPEERLGSNGFTEIKNHAFFEGINFEELSSETPPTIQHIRMDTELAKKKKLDAERQKQLEDQKKNSIWNKFMFDNELIIHSSVVIKRKSMIKPIPHKRQLILTDLPRLIYVDPDKMHQKGEIPWSSKIKVLCKNEKSFTISVPNRTFYLEDVSNGSSKWYESISNLVQKLEDQSKSQ